MNKASGDNGSDATTDADATSQWRLFAADIFWEGAPEQCSHCNATIESAYGDPDAEPASDAQKGE